MYLDVYERDTLRYNQDTCKIHQDTSGYVSDRKLYPKTIGNCTSPRRTAHGRAKHAGRRTGWLRRQRLRRREPRDPRTRTPPRLLQKTHRPRRTQLQAHEPGDEPRRKERRADAGAAQGDEEPARREGQEQNTQLSERPTACEDTKRHGELREPHDATKADRLRNSCLGVGFVHEDAQEVLPAGVAG